MNSSFFIPYSKANFPLKENFTVVTVMLICNLSFPRLHNFLVFVKTIAPSGIRLDDCHANDWGLHARMLLKSVWLMEKACRLDNSCFLDYTWHYDNFLTLMNSKEYYSFIMQFSHSHSKECGLYSILLSKHNIYYD